MSVSHYVINVYHSIYIVESLNYMHVHPSNQYYKQSKAVMYYRNAQQHKFNVSRLDLYFHSI